MSHFTVMVIGNDPEKQLKPYDENISMPEYCIGQVPDDEMRSCIEYYVQNKGFQYVNNFGELYSKFGKDWNSRSWRQHADGTWHEYSTYNKNSKWDWYVLGGRWSGFLKLKLNATGRVGESGVFGRAAESGFADQCLLRDIDIPGMRASAYSKATYKYARIAALFGGQMPELQYLWSDLVSDESKTMDEKRAIYNSQDAIVKLNELRKSSNETTKDLLFFLDLDEYQCTADQFGERAAASALSTFAVVKDGKWYERGEMGWWGVVSNKKEDDEWESEFSKLVNELPGDTLISIYDCHI